MIKHLSTLIEYFPGAANQTRCFTHILNLVVKSVLSQFDTPKKVAGGDLRDLENASDALAVLAQELEGTETQADDGSEEGDDEDEMGGTVIDRVSAYLCSARHKKKKKER